jgi:RecB family endonuclease NucS
MQEIEKVIRTNLAKNLSFIDSNLILIKEEYYLQNYYGSKGYIDILAKDSDNNCVIIELKRSNQSARQALHEITKYHSLLQQNLHVKDSEIRTIIIST